MLSINKKKITFKYEDIFILFLKELMLNPMIVETTGWSVPRDISHDVS